MAVDSPFDASLIMDAVYLRPRPRTALHSLSDTHPLLYSAWRFVRYQDHDCITWLECGWRRQDDTQFFCTYLLKTK